ncbi:hypothetical protein [Ectopseudomonas oleovorans]|uniref:hypothetical protein n=1 Tax=Ectopseudomonas oleovorans TaxID=301 RepID=UPI0024469FAC|nr:hypothetical protein [Pseudomonas oleovorans]MDG9980343.1 hypothetical protein [Pseudomonas oleovorans]
MLKQNKAVYLLSALALTILTGCGEEQNKNTPQDTVELQSTKCALDAISGEGRAVAYASASASIVDFRGWAVDSNSNTAPEVLNVVLKDKKGTSFTFAGAARFERPDVVKAFKQDAYLKSGFRLVADVSTLAEGTYSISLQMPVGSNLVTCATKKVLVITK